jgi:enamine deaminase RidA (YjgF/YER057c/UK114 family)
MSVVEERLAALGLALPAPFSAPPGFELRFELVRVAGDVAYVSGHGPMDGSTPLVLGKVGADVSAEAAYEAARATALSMFASLQAELGSLDRVRGWLKLELWGDDGHHARSAIGVAELPFDIPVEIEAIVQL